MKRILVLCGGQSPEHRISVRSCKKILKAVDRANYSITLIGITQTGRWELLDESGLRDEVSANGRPVALRPGYADGLWCHGESLGYFDAAFPVLHGPNGEDGTIQGVLRMLSIPFVGSGVLSSSVCMDKDVAKRLLREAHIKTARWITLRSFNDLTYKEARNKLGSIVYVKSANMGSSVGVNRVANEETWESAVNEAFKYDNKVLVEESVIGREVECAILGNKNPKATGVGEILSEGFYSYNEKYADNSQAAIIIPAKINPKYLPLLKETAIKVYKTLECQGMSRVDMFLTKEGEIIVNEVNTIPGFTSISMYPKLWKQEGLGYSDLIDQLINLAIERGV
ncbi:MAG: D-alanine--D-alanine ligase [Ekhidna sp.]|nr:D-alanine--D-alanine ligase [Ekhidna sp.]